MMQSIASTLKTWLENSKPFAMITIINIKGSAPRKLGAKMLVSKDFEIVGSISGGCLESAIINEAIEAIEQNQQKILHFGISSEEAFETGLLCGGEIDLLIEPVLPIPEYESVRHTYLEMVNRVEQKKPFITLHGLSDKCVGIWTIENNNEIVGPSISDKLKDLLHHQIAQIKPINKSRIITIEISENDSCEFFLEVFQPPSKLIIIGGAHIAVSLVPMAKQLGFETVLLDARKVFGNKQRFPLIDEINNGWPPDELEKYKPDENTFLVLLTHDNKVDIPSIETALKYNPKYIGVLGSRKTHQKRIKELIEIGVSEADIKSLYSPIGLDINAQTPEEISLAILAECIKIRNS